MLSNFLCLAALWNWAQIATQELVTYRPTQMMYKNHWVRSFSFPGSTPVCPRCVRIALTSFQGLTRVGPQWPACAVGQLWVTWAARRYHERPSVIIRLALVRGSPEWAPRGRPWEANPTHPLKTVYKSPLSPVSDTLILILFIAVIVRNNIQQTNIDNACYKGTGLYWQLLEINV